MYLPGEECADKINARVAGFDLPWKYSEIRSHRTGIAAFVSCGGFWLRHFINGRADTRLVGSLVGVSVFEYGDGRVVPMG